MAELQYKTERVEEYRKISKSGDVETWYRIYATTSKGTFFHVEVPQTALETDAAHNELSALASKLDGLFTE